MAISLSASGISGIGAVDNAKIVVTNSGPVVFWRDLSTAVPHLYAERFDGTNWVPVSTGSASGAGISGTTPVASDYSVASDGVRLAAAWTQLTTTGDVLQVTEFSNGSWQALPNPNPPLYQSSFSQSPSLAYSGGKLFLAWVQRDPSTVYDPHIFVASEQGGVWTAAGTGAASGFGVSANDLVSGLPQLAASGTTLRLAWIATNETSAGPDSVLRTLSWNGTSFVADQPSDITGTR